MKTLALVGIAGGLSECCLIVKHGRLRGVQSAICHPPSGGAIELLMVQDQAMPFAANLDEFLSSRGEGMYAVVLTAPDLSSVRESLAKRGLEVDAEGAAGECLVAKVNGVQIRIEANR